MEQRTPPITDPAKWLRDQEQRIAKLQEQANRTKQELADSVVTVISRDQAVTVRVNPAGVLLELRISPQAERLGAAQLTARIMETYQKARSQAAARTVEIMSGLVGYDSDAMNFLRSTLPDIDDEDLGPRHG